MRLKGDIYRVPWKEDAAVGALTPMMQARASYECEVRAALRKPGQKVCRTVDVGIAMANGAAASGGLLG